MALFFVYSYRQASVDRYQFSYQVVFWTEHIFFAPPRRVLLFLYAIYCALSINFDKDNHGGIKLSDNILSLQTVFFSSQSVFHLNLFAISMTATIILHSIDDV